MIQIDPPFLIWAPKTTDFPPKDQFQKKRLRSNLLFSKILFEMDRLDEIYSEIDLSDDNEEIEEQSSSFTQALS